MRQRAMARRHPDSLVTPATRGVALAMALGAAAACAGSARGRPISFDMALERARRALCTDGGVESPRALVEGFAPVEPCALVGSAARVRCYLAQTDTTIEVARLGDEVRIRVAIPQLSDHVHEVRVRRRGSALVVEVHSSN